MRFKRHIINPIALALALAASLSLAPVVQADPAQIPAAEAAYVASQLAQKPTVQPNPDEQGTTTHVQAAHPAPARVDNTAGFDWGDASIGAAGGIVLSMLGVGGVVLASQRHARRSREAAAVAN